MNIKNRIAITAVAGAALAIVGCGSAAGSHATSATTQPTKPAAASSAPATPKPAVVPVLRPGHSATFKAAAEVSGPAVTMTWTMGSGSVVRVPDNSLGKRGFEDVAFNLTIKNTGTVPQQGDPSLTTWLLARSPDGRTDETLQGTAATNIEDGTHGLNGSNLELESGVMPGAYVSGYVSWPVPASTSMVLVLNPNTGQPELQIDLGS